MGGKWRKNRWEMEGKWGGSGRLGRKKRRKRRGEVRREGGGEGRRGRGKLIAEADTLPSQGGQVQVRLSLVLV
jgi:hypothetical protein